MVGEEEILMLIEKRGAALESIQKLYNELSLVNKVKLKEYDTLLEELRERERKTSEVSGEIT